jgi:ribosomal protein L30E
MSLKDLKLALKEKKVFIGTERTIKMLKAGKVEAVFISDNCPDELRNEIKHYGSLMGAKLVELDKSNEELGAVCKKPFSVNILLGTLFIYPYSTRNGSNSLIYSF